jgi:predicted NUDIX family NTP pyrophosphohydrolase
MPLKKSAGLLLYRHKKQFPEFFLVHPGGPFWAKKDLAAWSIPKGEFTDDEEPLNAAIREFQEETGLSISGDFIALTPRKQNSGKMVYAWAIEADVDASAIQSNTFMFEWPPRSGKKIEIPEVDKAEWFNSKTAKEKIIPGQAGFIDELEAILARKKPS